MSLLSEGARVGGEGEMGWMADSCAQADAPVAAFYGHQV